MSRLPADLRQFLRVISISDPVPCGLAVELSDREDAASVLDRLEHQTSLVSTTGPRRDAYRIQKLLRTYLLADLHRHGPQRVAQLHATAARWWAGQGSPIRALDHAARSGDTALLSDLLHRFAVPLILNGDHRPLRYALSSLGPEATAADPWLALTSALTHVEVGDLLTARDDLRGARKSWPHDHNAGVSADLTTLRPVAEQFAAEPHRQAAPSAATTGTGELPTQPGRELPTEPQLEALARLNRGSALLLDRDDRDAARVDLEAALVLARRHGFDHLSMQCLVLLGMIAGVSGDLRTMRTVSTQALTTVSTHGWENSTWSAAASAMLAYAALLRGEAHQAESLSAEALALGPVVLSPPLRFALRTVHGAAAFDRGDRVAGLAELQQARAEVGDLRLGAEQAASAAVLEFRAALLLGHAAAARTVQGWLAERTDDNAELLIMRAWIEATGDRPQPARMIVHPVLDRSVPALLPHTLVEAFLLETALALAVDEPPAARRALQAALAAAAPLDALRPFTQAEPTVRALLAVQHRSSGPTGRLRTACAGRGYRWGAGAQRQTMLSRAGAHRARTAALAALAWTRSPPT